MIDATYFGEITQLHTRAIWYSDEEDEDDEYEDEVNRATTVIRHNQLGSIAPISHDTIRSNVKAHFTKIKPEQNLNFSSCVISSSSPAKFQNYKFLQQGQGFYFGYFDNYGKAFAFPISPSHDNQQNGEYLLWLLFDSSHHYLSGQDVGYFVEKLRDNLRSDFNFLKAKNSNCEIMILSQQFSRSEHIEYLTNFSNNSPGGISSTLKIPLPFIGRSILPPFIIGNNFESSLFEQLTLTLKPAYLICLPCPRDFLFDRTVNWPTIPEAIIQHKLHDNHLDDKYIFT